MSAILEAQGLRKVYRGGDGTPIEVLSGVDLAVDRGEFVAIVGASGSGKSTLLHLLGALDTPSAGTVRLDGLVYGEQTAAALAAVRNRKIGFVFQFHHLLREFSALENVMMPLLIAGEDEARGPLAGGGAARGRGAGGPDDAPPVAALGRRAAAGRGGPGAGDRPAGGPGRRAVGQPGSRQQRAAARAVRAAGPGVRDRAGGGHPQPLAGRPGRPGALARRGAPGVRSPAWSRCPDVLRPVPRARGGHSPHPDRQRAGDHAASLREVRGGEGGGEPGLAGQDAARELPRGHGEGRRAGAGLRAWGETCGRCGGTFQDFRETRPAGVPRLLPHLRGAAARPAAPAARLDPPPGRALRRAGAGGAPTARRRERAAELREQLRLAVETENFELAAELRDRLRVLE